MRMDGLLNWAKVLWEREGLPRLQLQHHLPTGTTDWMWVSSSGCAVPKGSCCSATPWCMRWPKRGPMLTKHEKCSAHMAMQYNTCSICGTRSLSWNSVACWSRGLSQLTGLHLVPKAMPRERKTGREPKQKHSYVSKRESKHVNESVWESLTVFSPRCLSLDVKSNWFEHFREQGRI